MLKGYGTRESVTGKEGPEKGSGLALERISSSMLILGLAAISGVLHGGRCFTCDTLFNLNGFAE